MEILMMIGSYAGEIRDVRPDCAHGLIERGEAIDPNIPVSSEIDVVASVAPADIVPDGHKKAKR